MIMVWKTGGSHLLCLESGFTVTEIIFARCQRLASLRQQPTYFNQFVVPINALTHVNRGGQHNGTLRVSHGSSGGMACGVGWSWY